MGLVLSVDAMTIPDISSLEALYDLPMMSRRLLNLALKAGCDREGSRGCSATTDPISPDLAEWLEDQKITMFGAPKARSRLASNAEEPHPAGELLPAECGTPERLRITTTTTATMRVSAVTPADALRARHRIERRQKIKNSPSKTGEHHQAVLQT